MSLEEEKSKNTNKRSKSTSQTKRDIFVVMSGGTPLHAVYTQRQADRFVAQYESSDDCRLFLGNLHWMKLKLIPPRKFTEKEVSTVRKALK